MVRIGWPGLRVLPKVRRTVSDILFDGGQMAQGLVRNAGPSGVPSDPATRPYVIGSNECRTEQLELQLVVLERFRSRPAMWVGDDDPERAAIFLTGFHSGVGLKPLELSEQKEVWESRGWKVTATSGIKQMIDRGLSPLEIIDQLVSIELEMLQREVARWIPELGKQFGSLHDKALEEVKRGGRKDI